MPSTLLHTQTCVHQSGSALTPDAVARLLSQVQGWSVVNGELCKTFQTADYHHTLALVNAIAWVAHVQDHHPELLVGYNRCTVRWSTHSVGGLSLNDFICAARVDALPA